MVTMTVAGMVWGLDAHVSNDKLLPKMCTKVAVVVAFTSLALQVIFIMK